MLIVQTVNFSVFRSAFANMNRSDNFSDSGLVALFDYLENLSEDTCENIELDVIALCCEYSEESADNIVNQYNIYIEPHSLDDDFEETLEEFEERQNEAVKDYLEKNTTVIMADNGKFLYANF